MFLRKEDKHLGNTVGSKKNKNKNKQEENVLAGI